MRKFASISLCILLLGIPLLTADQGVGISSTRNLSAATPGTECWALVSPYQSGTNAVEVLLPKGADPSRRYPVVYCLPVNAGTRGDWGHPLTEAAKAGLADKYQAIFVAPSFSIMPWFGNNPLNPQCRENDHVIKAVVPFIASHYPVNGTNYLIGFSKSALGAISLAIDYSDLFAGVAIFDN
jgi:predicted peptidase